MFNIISQYDSEIKTSMKYHYIPLRMAKIKDTDNSKFRCRATRTLIYCWWERKVVEQLRKTI